MRVLLDELLPIDLSPSLRGHAVDTVVGRGWAGVKNGDLLRRRSGHYDVLITMDRGMEFQQPIPMLPFGIVIVRAASNRMQHLRPLVPRRSSPQSVRLSQAGSSEWVPDVADILGAAALMFWLLGKSAHRRQ
jgi:hypothetical protein